MRMIEYWVEVYPNLRIPVLLYVCVNTMNYSTVLLGSLALRFLPLVSLGEVCPALCAGPPRLLVCLVLLLAPCAHTCLMTYTLLSSV